MKSSPLLLVALWMFVSSSAIAVGEVGENKSLGSSTDAVEALTSEQGFSNSSDEATPFAASSNTGEENGSSDGDKADRTVKGRIVQYLWNVYQRSPTKRDGRGDFTWKDQAAAERLGISVEDYVIGGIEPRFRQQVYNAGRAMDLAGIQWTILSGFRDDYRQSIASGFKARTGHSLHGGSVATAGYGHGCAVDIAGVEEASNQDVWAWLAVHAGEFGLLRPLPGIDPAHVQMRDHWSEIAKPQGDGTISQFALSKMGDEATSEPIPPNSTATLVNGLEAGCARGRLATRQTEGRSSTPTTGMLLGSRDTDALPGVRGFRRYQKQVIKTALGLEKSIDNARDDSKTLISSDPIQHNWVIQLAGGYSQAAALDAFHRVQRKYSGILGAYPAIVEGASGRAYSWFRARIAMSSRATATKVCASLRTAGGDCMVLPR